MACSQPFRMKQPKSTSFKPRYRWSQFTQFPCGWCLNCRVDRRNSLLHRAEKEFIDKKCGAFVTFTYDDPHLIHLLRKNQKGEMVATVSKDDARHFLYRLNKLVHAEPDTVLCNHHYKYIIVGEYGENGSLFDRPHFHCLFFGLDFAMCKKLFLRAWQGQGQIQIGAIQKGGLSYVLKYMDKQLFGDLAKMKYDQNNLERPFCHRSCGLGSSLYEENIDYAMQPEHFGCYRWKGKDVPYPPYYKNKYLLSSDKSAQFKKSLRSYLDHNEHMPKNLYDLHDWKLQHNKLRERNLRRAFASKGEPFLDVDNYVQIFRTDTEKRKYVAYKKRLGSFLDNLVRDPPNDIPF